MKKFFVDMWHKDEFIPKKYMADVYFNDLTGVYHGNVYNEQGKAIGDYTCTDSVYLQKMFDIDWI